MKLEVGMYVRTHKGICKIEGFASTLTDDYIENEKGSMIPKNEIKKVNHNIIDLIEAGDYVNGLKVIDIVEKDIYASNFYADQYIELIKIKDIKSIVTKEMFENMSYKIGD